MAHDALVGRGSVPRPGSASTPVAGNALATSHQLLFPRCNASTTHRPPQRRHGRGTRAGAGGAVEEQGDGTARRTSMVENWGCGVPSRAGLHHLAERTNRLRLAPRSRGMAATSRSLDGGGDGRGRGTAGQQHQQHQQRQAQAAEWGAEVAGAGTSRRGGATEGGATRQRRRRVIRAGHTLSGLAREQRQFRNLGANLSGGLSRMFEPSGTSEWGGSAVGGGAGAGGAKPAYLRQQLQGRGGGTAAAAAAKLAPTNSSYYRCGGAACGPTVECT
eukprot:COSAG01_NODE_2582_length_7421_cov_4.252253_4_plen_274_part_00